MCPTLVIHIDLNHCDFFISIIQKLLIDLNTESIFLILIKVIFYTQPTHSRTAVIKIFICTFGKFFHTIFLSYMNSRNIIFQVFHL